jgi:hypothetical protein
LPKHRERFHLASRNLEGVSDIRAFCGSKVANRAGRND